VKLDSGKTMRLLTGLNANQYAAEMRGQLAAQGKEASVRGRLLVLTVRIGTMDTQSWTRMNSELQLDAARDRKFQNCAPSKMLISAFGIVALITSALLTAGCASSSSTSAQPKPGTGIAEYRQLTLEAHRAVAATVNSLSALAIPQKENAKSHPEWAQFDRALQQLELTSVKTRARAEAIIARGQAYFDEWKGNLTTNTHPATARVEPERYARLHDHFDKIRERSGEVRTEFRPFMMKLRDVRATLDKSPSSAGNQASQSDIDALKASGQRLLDTLSSVSRALDDAEVELRATLAAQP